MELVQIASNAADFGICTIENFGPSTMLLPLLYVAVRKRFHFKYLKILGMSNLYRL